MYLTCALFHLSNVMITSKYIHEATKICHIYITRHTYDLFHMCTSIRLCLTIISQNIIIAECLQDMDIVYSTYTGSTTNFIEAGVVKYGISNATISYLFLNNQSFYCVVCCSTDPSVPPDSSVYKISTSRGTEVTVDLDGLTSGQMYYCKAAATNTTSASCGGPVVGGVKVFFNLLVCRQLPTDIPTSQDSSSFLTIIAVVITIIILSLIVLMGILVLVCLRLRSRVKMAVAQIPAGAAQVREEEITMKCNQVYEELKITTEENVAYGPVTT